MKTKTSNTPTKNQLSSWSANYRLPWVVQILADVLNIGIGVIPGLVVFFFWVERNCKLPWISEELKWPLIDLSSTPLSIQVLWNISLFFLFGFLHSFLAQKPVQRVMDKLVPPQLVRTFYMCVTGLTLIFMMANWQPTGITIWELPIYPQTPVIGLILSSLLFWIPMLYCGHLLTRFGILEFIGVKQHRLAVKEIYRTEGTPQLIISGMYRWVRHPVYTLTLLAFIMGPVMTLDRALMVFATLLYLAFGIPVEEKKLIRQFGNAYLDYKRRIPALIPFPVSSRS